MVIGHVGTFELGPGQTLSAEMIAKVFLQTDLRAATIERGQWGGGQRLLLEGPPGRLVEAMELVQQLVAEPVGGSSQDADYQLAIRLSKQEIAFEKGFMDISEFDLLPLKVEESSVPETAVPEAPDAAAAACSVAWHHTSGTMQAAWYRTR